MGLNVRGLASKVDRTRTGKEARLVSSLLMAMATCDILVRLVHKECAFTKRV